MADAFGRRRLRLDADALCTAARRTTGLEDFGDPPVEPALSLLVSSLEREAHLHPVGRFLMHGHLRGILETRLRLFEAWRETQPESTAPIERPIFITGMPRSGSTFLHELLAQDPDNRTPLFWEVMFPLPAPDGNHRRDLRVFKAGACLWFFRRLVRQADSIYPIRACTPHECVSIHSYALLSEEFVSTCRVPAYREYLRSNGMLPAYLWQKRFLQHLQGRGPARRWVLKAPDHVYGLEELFSVFPDAVIIQTHRNPLDVLQSSAKLLDGLYGLYAWPQPPGRIAAREAHILADAMDRFIRFRDLHPELADRFIDLRYSELVSDPLTAIGEIYEHLGLTFTEAAAARMRLLVSQRSRYRQRRRSPTLSDLGLDVPDEARRFNQYCFRFGVSCQQVELG